VPIIDSYGAHDRAMFALERKAMDRRVLGAEGLRARGDRDVVRVRDAREADRLLGFYLGDRGRDTEKLRFAFRVGLYFNRSRGSGR
jgi:hypothetical protein